MNNDHVFTKFTQLYLHMIRFTQIPLPLGPVMTVNPGKISTVALLIALKFSIVA